MSAAPVSREALGYRPALDGVRAIAIACVVVHHTIGFPATGFIGVDLFFVLSGFLITTLLMEEHARRGSVSFGNFYRRRALRLLPALVAVLGVFLALSAIAVLVRGGSLDRALFGVLAGIGYFTNLAIALAPEGTVPNELRHLWSLAIEEQFYLVWPMVLLLVFRARVRLALVGLAFALALATIQQVRLYLDGASWERIAYGSDTRCTSVVVGCALALGLLTAARPTLEALGRRMAPLGLVAALALLLFVPDSRSFSVWILAVAFCSAWLILLALDSRSLFARTLSLRPLVFLGRISYALYLWHIPIYVVFGLSTLPELLDVPALALSLACATASYYFVELPFLRRKRRSRSETEDRVTQPPLFRPAST